MTAAESIITKKVVERLFQPFSIFDPMVKDPLVDISDDLLKKSPRQESILRSLLLTAHRNKENAQEIEILNTIVDESVGILRPLLYDQACTYAFMTGLNALLRKALDLWRQAQQSPERIMASIEGANWGWASHKEHDDAVPLTPAEAALFPNSEEPVMTLFPRISALGDPNPVPIHQGYSLWSNQNIVIAGDLESEKQIRRVNSRDEAIASVVGRRRLSANVPAANTSFYQRMKSRSESSRDSNNGH